MVTFTIIIIITCWIVIVVLDDESIVICVCLMPIWVFAHFNRLSLSSSSYRLLSINLLDWKIPSIIKHKFNLWIKWPFFSTTKKKYYRWPSSSSINDFRENPFYDPYDRWWPHTTTIHDNMFIYCYFIFDQNLKNTKLSNHKTPKVRLVRQIQPICLENFLPKSRPKKKNQGGILLNMKKWMNENGEIKRMLTKNEFIYYSSSN